jgi:bifunctional oligoribonuclease and PAP phosphatase NrnA
MNDVLIEQTRRELNKANRILIVSHVRPDGDAAGSVIGLGLALQDAGKSVQMVLDDGVPASESYLSGSEQVRTKPEGDFDLAIVVDCSDLSRVGKALNGYGQPDWNIDHHITNLNFARMNLIQSDAASTAEIIAELIPAWGLSLSIPAASALLTGVLADTLGFRTSNVMPKTLRLTANLMDAGGNLFDQYRHALLQRSFQAARYWGVGLSKMHREGRMVWITLTIADRRAVGYSGCDDADLINVVSSINDIDVSMILIEQNNTNVKVSWRSQPGFDVSQVALQFGGGGHKAASGAEIFGTLEEVQEKVLNATRPLLGVA